MNILIADDRPVNLRLLRALLEAEGHAIVEAANGVEALEQLARCPVDAIISDILMPRMDGYRLCAEVRKSGQWAQIPFVFYTATYNSSSDEKLALGLGADVFLRKPASVAELLAALNLARRRNVRAPAHSLEDSGALKEYSERLVAKLEEKNHELTRANRQLRALAARLENVREEERTRIAREIHDVLAQELTRLKIDLVWVAKRLGTPIDETFRPTLVERIADATAQTDTAIGTVQRIATELRPVILDSLGLPAAVEWVAEDFARRTGIACTAAAPSEESALGRESATALFRILQESLTNIARHAEAAAVDVRLTEDQDNVTLAVRDNGRGISAAQLADYRSIGLMGMRERAEAFGGTLEIHGEPGAGTIVTVRMPINGGMETFSP